MLEGAGVGECHFIKWDRALVSLSCWRVGFFFFLHVLICTHCYIYLFGVSWVIIAAYGLSLFADSEDCCLVVLHRLLIVAEHRASVVAACKLVSCNLLAHRLSCSMACGIFLDHGSNSCPLN